MLAWAPGLVLKISQLTNNESIPMMHTNQSISRLLTLLLLEQISGA